MEFPPGAVISNASSSINYSNSSISPREDKFNSSPEMMMPVSRSRVMLRDGQGQINQRPASSIQLSTALSSINKNSDEYFDKIGGVGKC